MTVGILRYGAALRAADGWYVKGWQLKRQILSTSFWQGLHFSLCQEANPDFEGHWSSAWRAQRAIFYNFFKDFDVLAPKIRKFLCILAGHQHTAAGMLGSR